MKVGVAQAKAQLADLLKRVEAGEHVLITRRGKALATISPIPITEKIVYDVLTDPKNAKRAPVAAPRPLTLADIMRAAR